MEGRNAFNFYKSYYDVAKELDDKDRLAFYDAIMSKQFFNKESELLGNARFAYISQKHNIDRQVKGYMDKLGITEYQNVTPTTEPPCSPPSQDSSIPPSVDPCQQEKEKGQEEEKEKEELHSIDFSSLLVFINKKTGRGFKVINDAVQKKYKKRLKEGYTKDDIKNAISNAVQSQNHIESKFKYLTPEFFSRADKLDLFRSTKETIVKPEKNEVPQHHGIWSV